MISSRCHTPRLAALLLLVTLTPPPARSETPTPPEAPPAPHAAVEAARQRYETKRARAVEDELQRLRDLVQTFPQRVQAFRQEHADDRAEQRRGVAQLRAERDAAARQLEHAEQHGPPDVRPTLDLANLTLGDAGIPTAPTDPGRVQNYSATARGIESTFTEFGIQHGRLVIETISPPDGVMLRIERPVFGRIGTTDNEGYMLKPAGRVFVRGVDLTGLVNGREYKPDRPFYVSDTRTYESLGGTAETVFVIEPLPPAEDPPASLFQTDPMLDRSSV
jgi:hypothetical protein